MCPTCVLLQTLCVMQIVIHSDNDALPTMELTTFGARGMFEELKEVGLLRLCTPCGALT